MMGLYFQINAAILIALFLFLPACTAGKRTEVDPALRKTAEIERALREAEQYRRTGDFEGALEVSGAALAEYPGDAGLLKEYREIVEAARDAADDALGDREFARAGRTYAVLLRNYRNIRKAAGTLSFDRKYLKQRLKECSDRLALLALIQYRRGNLSGAIACWKQILEFEPENDVVRKSLNTASTQLEHLEKKSK